MILGVPKEIKDHETRVGITPAGVKALSEQGHRVLMETQAGALSAFADKGYRLAGAEIVNEADVLWLRSQMIVKVKEPMPAEFRFFCEGLTFLTYFHLAPLLDLTDALLQCGMLKSAYETIADDTRRLPLLIPMSEVAGLMSVQVGAAYLQAGSGGRGVLLGGVPGVPPALVCILGGGVVGTNAARVALGMGACVTILDLSLNRLRTLDEICNGKVHTLASNSYNVAHATKEADLVIGGVLIPGLSAPKILTKKLVANMKRGAVTVDVVIDQGGCIETAKPTTHSDPVYEVNEVVHDYVSNMPAAVPNTSTLAMANATLPYVMKLAQLGVMGAIKADRAIRTGVNTCRGMLTCGAIALSQNRPWQIVEDLPLGKNLNHR
jgi:alanine dehydrogenase